MLSDRSSDPAAARFPFPTGSAAFQQRQQGVTLIVVLVLLLVVLLGGLTMARMSEVGVLVSGNVAFKDRAVHASDVGVNTAFAALLALANDNGNQGNWYSATRVAADADSLPDVNWDQLPLVQIGGNKEFQVRYFVDRQCNTATVTDAMRQCLSSRSAPNGTVAANNDGTDALDPPSGRHFRITVRVTGPGGTTTFVQALVTKGLT